MQRNAPYKTETQIEAYKFCLKIWLVYTSLRLASPTYICIELSSSSRDYVVKMKEYLLLIRFLIRTSSPSATCNRVKMKHIRKLSLAIKDKSCLRLASFILREGRNLKYSLGKLRHREAWRLACGVQLLLTEPTLSALAQCSLLNVESTCN